MHMHISDGAHSNDRLRQERVHHNWRQQDLADLLGTTVLTIKRWEGGKQQPSAYFRARLCTLFGKSAEELGLLPEIQPILPVMPEQEDIWSVPFPRNPFFTGRDLVLDQLHAVLTYEPTRADLTRSYVLSGLGGIGKTQLALEYAYQHRSEYHTVFWIEAETLASLTSSFVRLAELLALPEATEENHSKIVSAVLHWLNRQERWLLIFDNVEDLSVLKPFLPVNDRGALLLTTRLQALGTLAQRVSLSPMTRREGGDFLLARTNYLGYGQEDTPIESQERMLAEAIATEMGGLPLALEQAGAYIDATQCGFSDYLHLFRQMQYQLLETHELSSDHPLSVSRTFSLAFEQVAQRQPLAADMLTVCAFLAPDAIPESFLLDGAPWLGSTLQALKNDPLAFAEAIKVLLSYSLLQRNASTRTISVHRLVQVVLQGRLTDAELRSRWRNVLEAMVQLFPVEDELQANDWVLGGQLLTHAQACLLLCEQWHDHEELCIPLMSHVASYLSKSVRYTEAEVLFRQAIHMGERILGTRHPLVAEALHGLANLFRKQSKYFEAESLFEHALDIREQVLGAQHPLTAASLGMVGYCAFLQGKYEQSEPLLKRALHIREQVLAPDDPQIATALSSLAHLYLYQGEYEQNERVSERALHIWEKALGPEHPRVATALNNLGAIYDEQGKYEQAMPYFQRALHIRERVLRPGHPDIAFSLIGLGGLYYEQGKYKQAEACYQQALDIWEQALGPEHPHLAFSLNDLGEVYRQQGGYKQAEACYQRALRIREQVLGPEHPDVALPLNNLGEAYRQQGKYKQAEACYQRALQIWEKAQGPEHPNVSFSLNGLANLFQEQGKYEQARPLYQRALSIREQHLDQNHPETAQTLHDLAIFYQKQNDLAAAISYVRRALQAFSQSLADVHPRTVAARALYNQLMQMPEGLTEQVPEGEPPGEVEGASELQTDLLASSRAGLPTHSMEVAVRGGMEQVAYTRTIRMREVTFTCMICGQTVTQLRYPSGRIKYCSEACRAVRAAQIQQERVARQRQKRQHQRETSLPSPQQDTL